MDPDSKSSVLIRLAPWLLSSLVVIVAGTLVVVKAMDGKDFLNALGFAGTIATAGRMMTVPTATSTTKQTDPSGVVTETKTQQPLGMPPPAVVVAPVANEPPKGPTP